jgi:hypothetical protein
MGMKATLNSLEAAIESRRDYHSPPLQLWHPDCNGNIPIYINAQGDWFHDGGRIERDSLVRLFASILRREDDGDYYLVTPHEKWRIAVEQHALLITDICSLAGVDQPVLEACLNTGKRVCIGEEFPLFLDPAVGGIAAMRLPHRLTALCTRSAWYRLVDLADTADGSAVLRSGSYEFRLQLD